MDIQNLLSLISSLNGNNGNAQMGGLLNFLNTTNKSPKPNENTQTQTQPTTPPNLDMNQLMPLLSMLNQNPSSLSNLFPMLNNLNLPQGLSGMQNLNGMQNISPLFSMFNNKQKTQQTVEKQDVIRSKNFNKPFSDYKKIP